MDRITFGRVIIRHALKKDRWDGDEVRKREEIKVLGKQGSAFMKEAEKRGKEEGPLFGSAFNVL